MVRTCFIKNYFGPFSKLSSSCLKGNIDTCVYSQFSAGLSTNRFYSVLVKMSSGVKKAENEKIPTKKPLLKENEDKKITRSVSSEAEKNWKDYYLKLPLEEKRKEYSCGKKYVVLDDVEGWPSYASKITKKLVRPLYDVNEELNTKISMWRGDITCLEIDVICNAANGSLLGGGGVDGAIHRAAGRKLYEECVKLNGCDTGSAKLSGGYKLPAKYILHTVGPIGEKPKLLASCYKTCLDLAKENKLRSIAFPCISTGIYGYDVEKATPVVMETIRNWLLSEDNGKSIDRIIFCVFLMKDVDVYRENLLKYFPVTKFTDIPDKNKAVDIPDKKKAKTDDSEKCESKEEKELSERKKPKTEGSAKSENNEVKERSELSQKKKPKTENSSKSEKEEAKEQKENKKEEQSVTDTAKLKSENGISEKNRNKSKNDPVVQESYL